MMTDRLAVSYVLPVRWTSDEGLDELADYLNGLTGWADEVIVVDGSAQNLWHAHRAAFAGSVRLLNPAPWPGGNGKVAGVMTGVRAAVHDDIILADDDVRYGTFELAEVAARLSEADLVRPQNIFTEWPWHARWDTGRTLLNRAVSEDFPGTFGVRRSVLLAAGGYAGDVLFENLELIRTIRAAGGREVIAADVFVPRRPPTVSHFWRLALELSLLPLMLWAGRRPVIGIGFAAVALALAEYGRRRCGGREHFPRWAALWALPWMAERSVCVWLALAARGTGGVRYAGSRLVAAAHSEADIRRQLGRRSRLES
jgi:hypothetical protein